MIKTVIFDLGKVIVPFDFNRGYRALEGLCEYRAAEIPARIGTTDLVHRFESGQVSPQDFVRELSELLKLRVTYDRFCEIWSSIFLPETIIPDSMLEGIARRYRLMLLSNTNAIHFDMIRANYPELRHFHDLVLSYQVGAMKPSPVIFREAIARAGCRAEECFFTDDVAAYVEAAQKEGMDATQFHSLEQIQKELRQRGVEW
jgi:putative hydrolase of the HAD superfamily